MNIVREGIERIDEIVNASSVGIPIEALPKMLDHLMQGHALIVDTANQKIIAIPDEEIFDDRSEPPSEYTPRQ